MIKRKNSLMVLAVIAIFIGCSQDSFKKQADNNPLNIQICDSCTSMLDIVQYEYALGSSELDLSGRMKYEWRFREVSVFTSDDKPHLNQNATFREDTLMRIFMRSNSSLEGYNEATSYFFSEKESTTDGSWKHFFFLGGDIFGFHKSVGYQNPKNVMHRWVADVSPELFLINYNHLILWLEGLENENYKVVKERCRIDGLEYWSKNEWKGSFTFKFEQPWIEDLLFHEHILYNTDFKGVAAEFQVVTYAPTETYAVYEEDNVYPLYYKIDLSDLAFLITIYTSNLPQLNLG